MKQVLTMKETGDKMKKLSFENYKEAVYYMVNLIHHQSPIYQQDEWLQAVIDSGLVEEFEE